MDDIRALLLVKQEVPEFVEKRKPHLIISLVTKREADQRPIVRQPSRAIAASM